MSVSVSLPNYLELIDDGITLAVSTTDYKTTTGTPALLKIEFTDYPTISESIILSLGGTDIEFEVVAYNATPTNYQLRSKDPTESTIAEWMTKVAGDFKANYYINRYFTITEDNTGGDFLIFTAKENGAEYTLALTESLTWLNEDTNTAGTSDVYAEQFKLIVALFHKDQTVGGTFERLLDFEASPNINSLAHFNISELLADNVTIDLPNLASSNYVERLSNQVKEYYAEVAYKTKANPQPAGLVTTAVRYAMGGGTSKLFRNQHLDITDYLGQALNPFLTWQPANKVINETLPQYLSWYCNADLAQGVHVETQVWYTNGETATFMEVKTQGFAFEYEVYRFRTGYDLVSGLAHGGKTVSYYDVYLVDEDDDTILTTKQRYIINRNEVHNAIAVAHLNGFGTIETNLFAGQVVRDNIVKSDYFETQLEDGGGFETSNYLRANVNLSQNITINSGMLPNSHKQWATDFLGSKKTYLLIDEEFVAVQLLNKNLKDDTKSASFSFSALVSINFRDKHTAADYIQTLL